jgi:DNA repair exonuclease SbcCD nuclease subunit
MKIACITDIHFDVKNGSSFFLEKYETFFRDTFFPEIERRGIDTVWILGDTWEYRTKIGTLALKKAMDVLFRPLFQKGIKVTMIYGNHDVAFKNTNEVNSVDFLAEMYPNIHVVRENEVIDFDGLKTGFISWIHKGNLEESLKWIENADCTALCGHFEVNGFEMHKGSVCTGGFAPNMFDRFDLVLSGHFHTISFDGRIRYLSNSFQTNWSDWDLDKGFWILDTKTLHMDHIKNPVDIYHKVYYNENFDETYDFQQHREKIVKVLVPSYSKINQSKFNLFLDQMNSVTFACDVQETELTANSVIDDNYSHMSNRELISAYITDAVTDDTVDKGQLTAIFLDIYDEATNMVETE